MVTQTREAASTISEFVRSLREDGALARALQPGDREPLVISFLRGTWCQYAKAELAELSQAYARIRATGARLVAIAPQTPHDAADFYARHPVPFPVLTDRESRTAAWFGLSYELPARVREVYRNTLGIDLAAINGDSAWRLPMSARYVIDRGVIVYARVDPDPCRRPGTDETIAFLEEFVA